MTLSFYTLLVIIGCGVVTWLPRVIPFMLVRKWNLPKVVMKYLTYVPLCILTALFIQGLLTKQSGEFPAIQLDNLLAALPTIVTAILTKRLLVVVIVGIGSMALIRFFGIV